MKNKKLILFLIVLFPSVFWLILELSTINAKKLPHFGPKTGIGKDTVFKGGTALYKLHGLNRFSEDLDFTLIDSKLDLQKLLKNVISDLRNINVHAKIKEFDDYKNQKNIKLEIKGPLYKGNKDDLSLITINISLREKPMYEAEHKQIFSQHPCDQWKSLYWKLIKYSRHNYAKKFPYSQVAWQLTLIDKPYCPPSRI